jgi:hypothetical protein
MAKKKARPKRKGPGLITKAAKGFAKGFDSSAEWMAKHTGPKAAKQRRASLEWTSKPGGNGERIAMPGAQQRGLAWGVKQTVADKEIWAVSFIAGPTIEFVTWPPRDDSEARRLAMEHVENLYGVYTQSWEIGNIEFKRKAVEDELPEDAKA